MLQTDGMTQTQYERMTQIKSTVDVKYNVRIKEYPSGLQRLTICSSPVFKDQNYERTDIDHNRFQRLIESLNQTPRHYNPDTDPRNDSIKRSKEKVFDIAMLNQFDYFITWTLNRKKIDRYSPDEVSQKLKRFLQNMVRTYDLCYVLIPEHHKDGAIHMHGLMSGNLKLSPAFHKHSHNPLFTKSGIRVQNCDQWKYGWSTAIPTYGENEHVARYITKYITKNYRKIFGNFTMREGTSTATQKYTLPIRITMMSVQLNIRYQMQI